jgi:hypothetical protein
MRGLPSRRLPTLPTSRYNRDKMRAAVIRGAIVLAISGAVPPPGASAQDLSALAVLDLDGTAVHPLASLPADVRGVVFVFTRSDCPIANRYAPDLERLQRRAAEASVAFWLVFVDPGERAADIREHLRSFRYTGRVLRDPSHILVGAAGATIAPEAAVFVRDARAARLIYRGRIDDRYLAPGRMRPAATSHDLEDAIDSLGDARRLTLHETQAVGCVIADLR